MTIRTTVRVDGVDELALAMRNAPPALKRRLTLAMRRAAIPAQNRAEGAVAWAGGARGLHVRIRARQGGAAVGNPSIVAPIIEFGHKAIITGTGVQAPHVRKLTPRSRLIPAVESTLEQTKRTATQQLEWALDDVLAASGTLPAESI